MRAGVCLSHNGALCWLYGGREAGLRTFEVLHERFKTMRQLFLAAVLAVAAATQMASADAFKAGHITIEGPHSIELPPVSENGAAYFSIMNHGNESDRLISAATPMAERAEFHTHEASGGMMKMRRVESVEVPAKQMTRFEPGGLHVMLLGLKQPLEAGQTFPLVLSFAGAGSVEVVVKVQLRAKQGHGGHATPPGSTGHGSHKQ